MNLSLFQQKRHADIFRIFCLGQVTDLKDVVVTQIALSKAHTVVLTDRGQVFTFGINNKGQCGRDFQPGGNKEGIYIYLELYYCIRKQHLWCVV